MAEEEEDVCIRGLTVVVVVVEDVVMCGGGGCECNDDD